jgi:hypothetical protein
MDVSVSDFTSIIFKPPYLLPVFFLVLQKYSLILEILSYLYNNILGIVYFTSHIEGLYRIGNISYCILLGRVVLSRNMCLFIILVHR